MTSSLERLLTKAKEVPSPHKVRLFTLDTNPVFKCLRDKKVMNFKEQVGLEPWKKTSRKFYCYIWCFKLRYFVKQTEDSGKF